MSVKNAARILIGRFGVVWGIMIFILAGSLILLSFSMVFVLPIIKAFREAGLLDRINELFDLMLKSTLNLESVSEKVKEIWQSVKEIYVGNSGVKVNFILLISLVFVVFNKFLLGYYELPMMEVFHDKMSYNAKTGFLGRFISNIKRSTLFILWKMIYSIIFDAVVIGVIYGLFKLLSLNSVLSFFIPITVVLAFILLQALRCSLVACWAAAVVVDDQKPLCAFKKSLAIFKSHFNRTFASFVIIWVLLFVINILFGLLTFGAALVLTIPASIAFIGAANMTIYYANTGRRYYITDEHIQKSEMPKEDDLKADDLGGNR